MSRERKTSTELKKLREIFKDIEEKKRKTVEPLIENAAFMTVELRKLQKYIEQNGCTETYQNGENQKGKKKSSEVEVYNTMIKNFTAIIKQLTDLLPEGEDTKDELLNFIGGKK